VQLSLTVAVPNLPDAHFLEDVEVFESILAQYATLRDASVETPPPPPPVLPRIDDPELRGHLVLVNQDNGEVVGEFDRKFSLQEDPALSKKGHEDDPVIIELAESGLSEGDARAMEMFVRAIPPDQHDWITRGATIIRLEAEFFNYPSADIPEAMRYLDQLACF
jgi:spartin